MNRTSRMAALTGGLFFIVLTIPASSPTIGQTASSKAAATRSIASPGVPGAVVAFGDQARVLAVGRNGETFAPVIVGGQLPGIRAGKIVLFGHDGYLSAESLAKFETRPFFFETAKWAARPGKSGAKKAAKPSVGLIGVHGLASTFEAEGWNVFKLDSNWPARITSLDLVVMPVTQAADTNQLKAIERYLREGGGLLTGITGWGWEQTHPGQSLATGLPLAPILESAGIMISNRTIDPVDSKSGAMAAVQPGELPLVHAGKAIAKLSEISKSKPMPGEDDAAQISDSLELALGSLGRTETPFRQALSKLVTGQSSRAVTSARPVRRSDTLERIAIRFRHELSLDETSPRTEADPSAADFPGAVPAKAPKITREITFPAGSRGRLGTGLYAPPGGVVHVRLQGGDIPPWLKLRLGAHSDSLWHLESWERNPEITRVRPIPTETGDLRISNPFGGLVYLELEKPLSQNLKIQFEGVVEAPSYVLGSTSKDAWAKLRKAPAPWAELRSRHVGLVLPSETVRSLDDPKPLLELWDRVMDSQNELGSLRREFVPTQWIVPDRQISAGYMHAGNPIMTGLDAAPIFSRADKLLGTEPGGITWGILHEIGHNRQRDVWTPSGLGEVTNNLFALYVYDKLLGKPSFGHPGLLIGQKRIDALKRYRATGPDFERFKSDPFLALAFFMEIQEAFGWKPFVDHFTACEAIPRRSAPRTDEARWDLWLTGLSKSTGKNLSPHFEAWGIPVSAEALKSVESLPKWNPPSVKQ